MQINTAELDRHVTGNYGEDSVEQRLTEDDLIGRVNALLFLAENSDLLPAILATFKRHLHALKNYLEQASADRDADEARGQRGGGCRE